MRGESWVMTSSPDTYQGEEKQDWVVLTSRPKGFQRRILSVCQDHRASSYIPLGTLKIQTEGNFNIILATEKIFYTSKNNMLFLVSWHILAWFPDWKSSNFSTLNLWCHLGMPKELRKQTHDVLSWNLVFKTNPILYKTQLCPLILRKTKDYSAFTPLSRIGSWGPFYNRLRICNFIHCKLDFKFYALLDVSLSYMSHEFVSTSISYLLAKYSNLEIFAYYKIVLWIIVPKANPI